MPLTFPDLERLVHHLNYCVEHLLPNSALLTRIKYLESLDIVIDPTGNYSTCAKITRILDQLDAADASILSANGSSGIAQEITIVGEYSVKYQNGVSPISNFLRQKDNLMLELCKILDIPVSTIYQGRVLRG